MTGNTTGRGKCYVTNGSQVEIAFKVPDFLTGYQEPYFRFKPGEGDMIYHRGKILFSFGTTQNDGTAINLGGVWAYDIKNDSLCQVSDNLSGGQVPTVLIPDQSNNTASGMAYIAGWYGLSSTFGIATSSTAAGIGGAVIKTDIIPAGTFLRKKTFKQVEIVLGTPLASGESIAVTAIKDYGLSTSNVATFNTAGEMSFVSDMNIDSIQAFQLQLTMTGNSATSGCRIRSIRLR
jgi:hypothetical protein